MKRPSRAKTRKSLSRSRQGAPGVLARLRHGIAEIFAHPLRLLFVVAIWLFIFGAAAAAYFAWDLPRDLSLTEKTLPPSLAILARDGTLIANYGERRGAPVPLNRIAPTLPRAVMAIEDRRFYEHGGVDVWGILRAAMVNIWHGQVRQGGSTLTQQLAKNRFLTAERTLKRKIQELMLAFLLERRYSKDEILAAYLNSVYFGAGAFGVRAAADTYFNKTPDQLTLRESALLAGLLRAPARYSPRRSANSAAERTQVVLQAMRAAEFLTEAELAALEREPPSPRRKPGGGMQARYFVDWVAEQALALAGTATHQSGRALRVRTTLEVDAQLAAEQNLAAAVAAGADARIGNAGLVSLAPDGAVRAMVGGADYTDSQFNRATQALRQPGSAFKPFVYLQALAQGFRPDQILEDAPVKFGRYAPGNYDGAYRGPVPLRTALAQSINTIAVKLLDAVGAGAVVRLAGRLGITTRLEPNLSLALGTSAVTLLDLTAAYAGIANGGKPVLPYGILEVVDERTGKKLYQHSAITSAPVVSLFAVSDLIGMMEGVVREGTGQSAHLGVPAAGKTGTTNDYRDAWFIGFTADATTGVWMGNDNNRPMRKVTGGGAPARLWRDYMQSQPKSGGALYRLEGGVMEGGLGGVINRLLGP